MRLWIAGGLLVYRSTTMDRGARHKRWRHERCSLELAETMLRWSFCDGKRTGRERSLLQTHERGSPSGAELGRGLASRGVVALGSGVVAKGFAAAGAQRKTAPERRFSPANTTRGSDGRSGVPQQRMDGDGREKMVVAEIGRSGGEVVVCTQVRGLSLPEMNGRRGH